MLTKTIEAVLSRAMSDKSFADALFANAEKALAEYNLTAAEIAKFKGLFSMDVEVIAASAPEERRSFTNIVRTRVDN